MKSSAFIGRKIEFAGVSKWNVFEMVFQDMSIYLVDETNKYASRNCNLPSFKITPVHIYKFLRLLLFSGYNLRTSKKDY